MIEKIYKRKSAARMAIVYLLAAQALFFSGVGQAEVDKHAAHRKAMQAEPTAEEAASVELHNMELLDQNGETVRFVDDVMGDRIVVMDFVYTTCTTVCPVLSAIFGQVQKQLADDLGPELRLVSVSVDPVRDTPERLKAYAASHRAGPDWLWLTGEKSEIDEVLRGLGAYTPNFEDHPSMVLVGDVQTGQWKRFFGFPGPDKILAAVASLRAARQVADAR